MNGPPSFLRERVLTAAAERPSATRKSHRQRRLAFALVILAFVIGSSTMLAGRHPEAPARPMAYLVTMLSASVVVAVVTAYYTLGPTPSATGRSSRFQRILTIATPFILTLAALMANVLAPMTLAAQTAPDAAHVACSTITFIAGAAVLAVMLALERGSSTTSAVFKGASLGAVAAAWGTLFISISCPYAHPFHVVPTHVLLPLVPLLIGGIVAGTRILSIRADRVTETR